MIKVTYMNDENEEKTDMEFEPGTSEETIVTWGNVWLAAQGAERGRCHIRGEGNERFRT